MADLKVGDSVLWRGGWGSDPEKSVKVRAIQINESNGSKYGEDVQLVEWNTVVERKVLVDLDNEHWAWGNQIRSLELSPIEEAEIAATNSERGTA